MVQDGRCRAGRLGVAVANSPTRGGILTHRPCLTRKPTPTTTLLEKCGSAESMACNALSGCWNGELEPRPVFRTRTRQRALRSLGEVISNPSYEAILSG